MKLTDEQVRVFLNKVNMKIIEKGMTKTEFYEKSGISSALFSQWNTGTNIPTEKSISKVASALDTTVEYLLPDLTGEGQKNSSLPDGKELTDTQKEAMEFVLTLNEEQLRQFIKGGKAMYGEEQ